MKPYESRQHSELTHKSYLLGHGLSVFVFRSHRQPRARQIEQTENTKLATSRIRIVGVREEQQLAANLVIGDGLLSFQRN
jgi:hypothetical protein